MSEWCACVGRLENVIFALAVQVASRGKESELYKHTNNAFVNVHTCIHSQSHMYTFVTLVTNRHIHPTTQTSLIYLVNCVQQDWLAVKLSKPISFWFVSSGSSSWSGVELVNMMTHLALVSGEYCGGIELEDLTLSSNKFPEHWISLRWNHCAWKGFVLLQPVCLKLPKGCPQNSANVGQVEHRLFQASEIGYRPVHFSIPLFFRLFKLWCSGLSLSKSFSSFSGPLPCQVSDQYWCLLCLPGWAVHFLWLWHVQGSSIYIQCYILLTKLFMAACHASL